MNRIRWIMMELVVPLLVFGGVYFDRSSNVREISTKYFRIFYAQKDEYVARRLFFMADKLYEEWRDRLGINVNDKFCVILTSDEEILNGEFTSLPRNTIVLYNYLSYPSLILSDDALEALFVHEMLHALSLNVRTPFWNGLRWIVGDVITPHYFQMPWWMYEGITVSGESFKGGGRVNMPSVRARLCEHYAEGQFEDYSDVAQFQWGGFHYIYGGYFSSYLQEKYGWEKYGDLWKESAKAWLPYSFESFFKRVYGVSLSEEWKNFASQFALSHVERPVPQRIVRRGRIIELRQNEEKVYLVDGATLSLYEVGKKDDLRRIGEGETIVMRGEWKAIRKEYFREGKPKDGFVVVSPLGKEVFLPHVVDMDMGWNGEMLCVRAKGLTTELVLRRDKREEVLLPAQVGVQYVFPRWVSQDRYVFVAIVSNRFMLVEGNRQGSFLSYDLSHYEVSSLVVRGDDVWMTVFPRGENNLGRVAVFSLATHRLRYQTTDVLGGIHRVAFGENGYYVLHRYKNEDVCAFYLMESPPWGSLNEGEELGATQFTVMPSQDDGAFLSSQVAGKWSDMLPAIRVPIVLPDPVASLFFERLVWNGFLYLSSEDPLKENMVSILYYGLWIPSLQVVRVEWQNTHWYPFVFRVGGSTSRLSSVLSGDFVYGGIEWVHSFSSREGIVVFNVNTLGLYPEEGNSWSSEGGIAWFRTRSEKDTRPCPVFSGPLLINGAVSSDGLFYGTTTLKWSGSWASMAFVGGYGNEGFYSPLSGVQSFLFSFVSSHSYESGRLYQGFAGVEGEIWKGFVTKMGYGLWPLYLETVGAVLGGSYINLFDGNERDDFASFSLQLYTKWIVGYIVPLSLVSYWRWTTMGSGYTLGVVLVF